MLPPRYAHWLTELLGGTLPEEQAATCSRCAMQVDSVEEGYRFRADAKCCTYVPALANFLVGAALRELPPGPARVGLDRRVADPGVCTPHGLDVSEDERTRYQAIVAAETFGRAPGLRCPHYLEQEGGLCGIWRHRNGVCATWFCKHDRGVAGQQFWQAVEALLALVERELSHWCACQLLYHGAATEPASPDETVSAWDPWAARPADYYMRAAALVDELAWPEVQIIAGAELGPLLARVKATHAELRREPAVPSLVPLRRLVPGALRVSHRGSETSRIVTYSDSDPLDLPSELLDILPQFDGRPTDEVLAELASAGIVLTDELVAQLVDFAVLTDP